MVAILVEELCFAASLRDAAFVSMGKSKRGRVGQIKILDKPIRVTDTDLYGYNHGCVSG